jgi:glycosyltransferase involved in cell wall biosynthesis
MTSQSILIITIPPLAGGVPDKARILVNHLRDLGHEVTVAHYATLSDYADLVVPSWQSFSGKRPGSRKGTCFDDFPCVSIGCRFPELEFTYYRSSPPWRELIEKFDRHIIITGTVLTAHTITKMGLPHLVWCASTMLEDRIDRRRAMPLPRRLFDRLLVSPILRVMEKAVLNGTGRFMAVSNYTRHTLVAAGGNTDRISVTPIPIDLECFQPPPSPAASGVIGFAGRPEDGRKNLSLLFAALKLLREQGKDISLKLTGDPSPLLQDEIKRQGLSDHITWTGWLQQEELPAFYQGLDVFVIPSFQEGLNIAGLQAMASGVPVISTRCGGPEDYVIENETGRLVGFDASEMAKAVATLVDDRKTRDRLGSNARRIVEDHYSHDRFASCLADAWEEVWGDRPETVTRR